MNILLRGTEDSNTQNYADRILAMLSVQSFSRFAKKTLILQTGKSHPVEEVFIGSNRSKTQIKNEFTFNNSGMDAIWKNISAGSMNANEWSDVCRNLTHKETNGLDLADVSTSEEFSNRILTNMDTFADIVKSAAQCYDVIFIFADGRNTKLVKALNEYTYPSGTKLINKEIVCIPQGPEKKEEAEENKYFAIKNFAEDSDFTIKEMQKIYSSKKLFPVIYNVKYRDACLKREALNFLSTNVNPSPEDVNFTFVEAAVNFLKNVYGIEDKNIVERSFVFKRG